MSKLIDNAAVILRARYDTEDGVVWNHDFFNRVLELKFTHILGVSHMCHILIPDGDIFATMTELSLSWHGLKFLVNNAINNRMKERGLLK